MSSSFSDRVNGISPSGIREFFDLVISTKGVISLGVGEPDFPTPRRIRDAAIESLEKGYTSYTSNDGLLECREAIAGYFKRQFNVDYNPANEVILTMGVSEGADLVFRALLNEGDEVILPEPNYVCYSPLIELTGGVCVPHDTSASGFVPDPEALASLITDRTKAIVLCSPSNPTGMTIPKKTLEAIAEIARAHDLWVISDEIYAELYFNDAEPYTSFASLPGMKERTVVMSGFSKAFAMTGWRLGYLAGPEALISRALKIHQYCALCAPIMSQFAAIEAVECMDEVATMRESYLMRRNFIVSSLNEMGLETIMPTGAFYCFPSIRSTGLSSKDFAFGLLDFQQVAVVPGDVFGQGGDGYIRCCYATSMELLKEAMSRMETYVNSLRR